MPYVVNVTTPVRAPACPSTLVIRTAVVVRNAYKIPIAIAHVLASTTSARIHVRVHAASMPSVAY